MCSVEQIADEDDVCRLISRPRLYTDEIGLLWTAIFEFAKGTNESLVWCKYAPSPEDVHGFGCAWQKLSTPKKPNMRYAGYISVRTGTIRSFETKRGHGFFIVHAPDDGQGRQHAEIGYKPKEGVQLQPADKSELKYFLQQSFSPLAPHACAF